MNELKPRSAEQATCSAKAELAEADVKRAFELCNTPRSGVCKICPYHEFGASCHTKRNADALALYREKDELIEDYRQELGRARVALNDANAEIERLRKAKYIYSTVDYCADDLAKAQEEIERLTAYNANLLCANTDITNRHKDYVEEAERIARAEAITEFAERLKSTLIASGIYPVLVKNSIEKITKEMKEVEQ